MTDMAAITRIPGALQSATGAIQRSAKSLDADADVVAKAQTAESRDSLQALIDSRQQLLYTKAAAKLIDTSDEMMSTILDITA